MWDRKEHQVEQDKDQRPFIRWDDPEEMEERRAFSVHRERHRRPYQHSTQSPQSKPAPPKPLGDIRR
jgi:hypothetical protein